MSYIGTHVHAANIAGLAAQEAARKTERAKAARASAPAVSLDRAVSMALLTDNVEIVVGYYEAKFGVSQHGFTDEQMELVSGVIYDRLGKCWY